MHAIDFIVIAVLLVCVFFAVRHLRKNGSCGCNCNCSCSQSNCHCNKEKSTEHASKH